MGSFRELILTQARARRRGAKKKGGWGDFFILLFLFVIYLCEGGEKRELSVAIFSPPHSTKGIKKLFF